MWVLTLTGVRPEAGPIDRQTLHHVSLLTPQGMTFVRIVLQRSRAEKSLSRQTGRGLRDSDIKSGA